MKHNVALKRTGLKLVCALSLLAVAGIAGQAYAQWQSENARSDENARITAKLGRIVEAESLLRAINEGRSEEVRQNLSCQLAHDIADLRPAMDSSTNGVLDQARVDCDRILRNQRAHPELYLAGSPMAQAGELKAWEAAANEKSNGKAIAKNN